MKILLSDKAYWHARSLIKAGLIERGNFSFSKVDFTKLLGENGNDYDAVDAFHFAQDGDVAEKTDGRYIYPYGKNGSLYEKALDSILEEASVAGHTSVVETVNNMKREIAERDAAEKQQISLDLSIQAGKKIDSTIVLGSQFAKKEKDSTQTGMQWDVVIMEAGLTKTENPTYITKASLEASKDVFNGAKLYAVLEGDYYGHKKDGAKKIPREMIGIIDHPRVEGSLLIGTASIMPSETWFADNLKFLDEKGQLNAYQLSIDASILVTDPQYIEEIKATAPYLIKVTKASVDVVGEGGAGGKFLRMVATKDETNKENNNSQTHNKGVVNIMKNKLYALFAALYPVIFAAKNIDIVGVDENELYSNLFQANKAQPRMHLPEGYDKATVEPLIDAELAKIQGTKVEAPKADPPPAVDLKATLDPLQKRMQDMEVSMCAANLRASLAESKLPKITQDKISKQYQDKIFKDSELQATINAEREYLAQFTKSEPDSQGRDIVMGQDQRDKMSDALAATMLASGHMGKPIVPGSPEMKAVVGDASPLRSIKELYIACTGDVNVTGNPAKMRASIDTTGFDVVCGNALNKALVANYNQQDMVADVGKVANITDLNSIAEQKRIRFGGYSDAPTVAEGDPYVAATSPDDEKAVYTPVKKGFTEDITLETIKKDDINAIAQIAPRVSRACVRTLYKTVFGLLDPGQNATIYDSTALYTTTGAHANLGGNALDATYLGNAVARMLAQKEATSLEVLGIRPGFLLVPAELEKTAYELVTSKYGLYNDTPGYLQSKQIQILPVPYWSGLTPSYGAAAKNWALIASRQDGVPIEVGFVDGQRVPELFISNLANVGSLFTNDKITYKVRFWFGAAVIDYRFADGSIVS